MESTNRLTDSQTLRGTVDRLFQDNVVRPIRGIATSAQGWFPVDVVDQGDQLVIHASLPGVDADDLNVNLQGETLTIRGDPGARFEDGSWLVRERPTGSFNRTISLPFRVDADRVEAELNRGILTLRLPKAGDAPSKRISIKSATAPASPAPTTLKDHPATLHMQSGTEPRDPEGDEVTEASIDSFPASDPPAWGSHRV